MVAFVQLRCSKFGVCTNNKLVKTNNDFTFKLRYAHPSLHLSLLQIRLTCHHDMYSVGLLHGCLLPHRTSISLLSRTHLLSNAACLRADSSKSFASITPIGSLKQTREARCHGGRSRHGNLRHETTACDLNSIQLYKNKKTTRERTCCLLSIDAFQHATFFNPKRRFHEPQTLHGRNRILSNR